MKELIEELFRLSQKARRENKGKYGREILTLSDFRKELFGAIDPRVMETKKRILDMAFPVSMVIEQFYPGNSGSAQSMLTYETNELTGQWKAFLYEISPELQYRHRHNYYEIIFVQEGQYCINIEGEKKLFHKNDICLLDRNCQHIDLNEECSGMVFFLGIKAVLIDSFFINNLLSGKWYSFIMRDLKKNKEATINEQIRDFA